MEIYCGCKSDMNRLGQRKKFTAMNSNADDNGDNAKKFIPNFFLNMCLNMSTNVMLTKTKTRKNKTKKESFNTTASLL